MSVGADSVGGMAATQAPEAVFLRPHAEQVYGGELAALARADDRARPPSWRLSPQAVGTYLLGGGTNHGTAGTPKDVGPPRPIAGGLAPPAAHPPPLPPRLPRTAQNV